MGQCGQGLPNRSPTLRFLMSLALNPVQVTRTVPTLHRLAAPTHSLVPDRPTQQSIACGKSLNPPRSANICRPPLPGLWSFESSLQDLYFLFETYSLFFFLSPLQPCLLCVAAFFQSPHHHHHPPRRAHHRDVSLLLSLTTSTFPPGTATPSDPIRHTVRRNAGPFHDSSFTTTRLIPPGESC